MGIHDEREFNRALDQFTVDQGVTPFPIFRWVNTDGATIAFLMSDGSVSIEPLTLLEKADNINDETFPRLFINNQTALASGSINFSVFTSRSDATINTLRVANHDAAGATPTLIRAGVWEWNDDTDSGTLVASSANDTSKFSAGQSVNTFTLSSPWNKRKGIKYAIGVLVVSGFAMPSQVGIVRGFTGAVGDMLNSGQRLAGIMGGNADLPTTLTSQTGGGPVTSPYWQMLT